MHFNGLRRTAVAPAERRVGRVESRHVRSVLDLDDRPDSRWRPDRVRAPDWRTSASYRELRPPGSPETLRQRFSSWPAFWSARISDEVLAHVRRWSAFLSRLRDSKGFLFGVSEALLEILRAVFAETPPSGGLMLGDARAVESNALQLSPSAFPPFALSPVSSISRSSTQARRSRWHRRRQ
jgi:hypothetical protein